MLNLSITIRLLSLPTMWMALVHIIFALMSQFIFHDHVIASFILPGIGMLLMGLYLLLRNRAVDFSNTTIKDAIVYATLTWVFSGLWGSIPIMIITDISFTNAFFESISALTTTGATVITNLDDLPKTFLLYRQFLQWMGGLGIVIFVVAVVPMLNVGGMKLLQAETPGPIKDDKLSPRIAKSAHYLWGVYILITVLCAVSYRLAGMDTFDAIAHSLTTVSTGGFSTHDASMGYFNSATILWVSNLFMILGATSFALHFKILHSKKIKQYYQDEETRIFLIVIGIMSVVLTLYLINITASSDSFEVATQSTFHIVSFITSTGYSTSSLGQWPVSCGFFLIIAAYLGGCAGSTAGGNKFIRNIITMKIIHLNMKQLIHPNAVYTVKFQGQSVTEDLRNAVVSFLFVVAVTTVLLMIILMFTGLDFWTSFTAVAACINVLGPGFGDVANNFQSVNDFGTWVLSGAMILGRLEYFTVLALFTSAFWHR